MSDIDSVVDVQQVLVKKRERKLEFPTKVKLLLRLLLDVVLRRPDVYVGGDDGGSAIIAQLKQLLGIRFVNFLLEYPDVEWREQLQRIEIADILITHDHWHSDFLKRYCNLEGKQVLYLPNASYTDEYHGSSDYLGKRLKIDDGKAIILHSGGLGKWFMCKELAESAKDWSDEKVLVFHTSHNVEKDPYYLSMKQVVEGDKKVLFSMKPVPNDELDELVASASIGVALYSVNELGYRAEYMGVAAGKIGNYLKCGVPVIVNRLPSLTYIEDYHCGVLIDQLCDINQAIDQILSHYEDYRNGAYRCYRELWYPKHYLEVIERELSELH